MLGDQSVSQIEKRLGIEFPDDIREFMKQTHQADTIRLPWRVKIPVLDQTHVEVRPFGVVSGLCALLAAFPPIPYAPVPSLLRGGGC